VRVRAALSSLLVAAVLAAGCSHLEPAADATPAAAPGPETIADLEKMFWHCDYVATKRGVLATPMAACKHAMDELKRLKFNGRYSALVEWWRENKVVEHRKVELSERASKI
jgi:hypothetical protein